MKVSVILHRDDIKQIIEKMKSDPDLEFLEVFITDPNHTSKEKRKIDKNLLN